MKQPDPDAMWNNKAEYDPDYIQKINTNGKNQPNSLDLVIVFGMSQKQFPSKQLPATLTAPSGPIVWTHFQFIFLRSQKENSPTACNKDRKIFDKEFAYSLKNVIAKPQDFFIDEGPDAPKWAEAIA